MRIGVLMCVLTTLLVKAILTTLPVTKLILVPLIRMTVSTQRHASINQNVSVLELLELLNATAPQEKLETDERQAQDALVMLVLMVSLKNFTLYFI